jgi:hypothetical protein
MSTEQNKPALSIISDAITAVNDSFASSSVKEAFANPGSGHTGTSREDQRIAGALEKKWRKNGPGYDVDHMNGPIRRDVDMATDVVEVKYNNDWTRAVNTLNRRLFDDNSDFVSTNEYSAVIHNGVVWAIWKNREDKGWFNSKGRDLPKRIAGNVVSARYADEGITDRIKRGIKSVKRGLDGWGGIEDKPADLVKRNRAHSDKTVKNLALKNKIFNDVDGEPDPHTPAGLQQRVLRREIKRRGLDEVAISEDSSLSSLGVDPAVISTAHKEQGLSHNEQFKPVNTKTELQALLKKGHIVVVVGPEQSAVITLARQRSIYVNRDDSISYEVVSTKTPNGKRVNSLADAMALAGKGQYYASAKAYRQLETPWQRNANKQQAQMEQDIWRVREEITTIYGPAIKKAAQEAKNRVKRRYMRAVEKGDKYELRKFQSAVEQLNGMIKNGYPTDSWGFSNWYNAYLRSLGQERRGFGSVPDNEQAIGEIVNTPLFKQKYAQFILGVIREIEENTK